MSEEIRYRNFDVLLCTQVSLQVSFISALIPAIQKLSFDKARSKELHSFFINRRVNAVFQQHVLDSLFSFIEYLGLHDRDIRWNYNIPEKAHEFANQQLAKVQPKVIISPCSSHSLRNWTVECYVAVADHAIHKFNVQVI